MADEVGFLKKESLLMGSIEPSIPAPQIHNSGHFGRQHLVIQTINLVIAHHQIPATALGLSILQPGHKSQILFKKIQRLGYRSANQAITNQQIPAMGGVNAGIGHGSTFGQDQSV